MDKKRISAFLLAAVLASGTLTACSEAPAEKESQPAENAAAETTSETEPETEADIFEPYRSINLNGRSVRISVSSHSADGMPTSYYYIAGPEEVTGELAKDNAFERNILVEELLNCTLEYEELNLNYDQVQNHVTKLVIAGDAAVDYYVNDQYGFVACANRGDLLDAADSLNFNEYYFDFDSDAYYTEYMDGINVGNRIYMITGDYFIDTMRAAHGLYMNTNMYGNLYGTPHGVYEKVLEGKWTLDEFCNILETSYSDANGNGTADESDSYGVSINTLNDLNAYWMFYYSTDSRVVDFDESGFPYPADDNADRMAFVADRLINIQYSTGAWKTPGVNEAREFFVNDQAIFCTFQKIGGLEHESIRNFDGVGVIPYPMADENQDGYRTVVHDTAELGVIPITTTGEAASAVSAVIQVMAVHAHANMRQDYFETILKQKYAQDKYTAQMLDIIVEGIRAPFEYIYINNYAYSPISGSISKGTNVVASQLATGRRALGKVLENLIEKHID